MSDRATISNGSEKNELNVEEVPEGDIEARKRMGKYEDAIFLGTVMNVTDRVVTKDGEPFATASEDSTGTGYKSSGYVHTGESLIMRFKDKIKDLLTNFVNIILKGKDKTKNAVAKKRKDEADRKNSENEHETK